LKHLPYFSAITKTSTSTTDRVITNFRAPATLSLSLSVLFPFSMARPIRHEIKRVSE
jgi:hypothetical protein